MIPQVAREKQGPPHRALLVRIGHFYTGRLPVIRGHRLSSHSLVTFSPRHVLTEELSKNYAEVSVEVVDCPDLKKSPFTLAASGLGGKPEILDMGGPMVHPDFAAVPYNLDTIVSRNGGRKKGFIIGAAQGPASYPFGLSEIVVNVVLNSPASYRGSIAALSNAKNDNYYLVRLPGNETGTTFVGNVLVSEGKPGKVVQVHVKKRIGSISAFPDNIQKILAKRYKGQLVGLGGTFLSKHGKVKQHVLESGTTKFHFLFYNMSAPLVSAGVILSAETVRLREFSIYNMFIIL
ncbi:ester hydrolase C11orf54 homolog [Belonocnema kinseyi]|uniref:ester hydrolase C11orf54 homolog n=1 Tax=Belonocnema kinseyi TaxID=2817044 RepID=UPI00143D79E0|nr:ester hydrolase C11orf54 homolog [Belonocnema kinseyi]